MPARYSATLEFGGVAYFTLACRALAPEKFSRVHAKCCQCENLRSQSIIKSRVIKASNYSRLLVFFLHITINGQSVNYSIPLTDITPSDTALGLKLSRIIRGSHERGRTLIRSQAPDNFILKMKEIISDLLEQDIILSARIMGETTEEEFSMAHMPNFGNESENDTTEYFANYSDEFYEMMDMLQKFYDDFGQEHNYVLVGLYVPVIPIAIVANILVIVVVIKNDYMRSPTNYFVVNLSVADLLVTTLCMPMAIIQAISVVGLYDEIICKLNFYLQGVAVAASVFTIMVMSFDRYMAIKNPIAFRRSFNQRKMSTVIFVIWLVSFIIFGPLLKAVKMRSLDEHIIPLGMPMGGGKLRIVQFKPPAISVCFEDLKSLGIDPSYFGITCFLLVYAIPVSVVLVVYMMMGRTLYTRKPPLDADRIEGSANLQQRFRLVRERKRVAWILLMIAVLFTLCWFPYNVLRLLLDLGFFAGKDWVGDTLSYCLFFGHVNSMLNPLVYCFMTRTFRSSISEILCHWRCGAAQRKHQSNPKSQKPNNFEPKNNLLDREMPSAVKCSSRTRANATCHNEYDV